MSIDLNTMSKLGFGMMRLPEQDGKIDLEQVCRMVDAYMESGMNYFDTAYPLRSHLQKYCMGNPYAISCSEGESV